MALSISVVTPSFNQAGFIERTLASVLSQDVADLEYLVVDGGSTDETVEVLQRYSGDLRPGEAGFRWISERDRGQTDAVNKGIRLTRGDIIGWLNSDDVYYPGALRTVLDFFETHPECDLVYGNAHHIDERDNILEPYPTEPWNFERLKETCYLCQPAVFFRRRVVHKHGSLDDRLQYCMDYEYWLRLAHQGVRVAWLPEYLAGSRLHAATKTLGSRVKVHREINDMFRKCLGQVPERWLYNYAHTVLDERLARRRKFPFAIGLSVVSCYAALRWNQRLSAEVLRTTSQWLWHNLPVRRPNKDWLRFWRRRRDKAA
jgi:glycosyltransferase involved in cell wall biosynthesis